MSLLSILPFVTKNLRISSQRDGHGQITHTDVSSQFSSSDDVKTSSVGGSSEPWVDDSNADLQHLPVSVVSLESFCTVCLERPRLSEWLKVQRCYNAY